MTDKAEEGNRYYCSEFVGMERADMNCNLQCHPEVTSFTCSEVGLVCSNAQPYLPHYNTAVQIFSEQNYLV